MIEIAIDPTSAQIKNLMTQPHQGKVVMINLLQLKPWVEETGGQTGAALYADYMNQAAPFLAQVGGKVLYFGDYLAQLIAPDGEAAWDKILLVEYPAKEKFLEMIQLPGYPSALRTKAVANSRLWATTTK
ncbi:MAG TPA: hypothetical protein DCM08_01060 [Microscillaceae bacterium]|nr:hypothetical protein [Microscillaceae bacterium]